MAKPPAIIDAEFEVVSSPLKRGDEHPTRPGWVYLGIKDADGDPLFIYKPHHVWREYRFRLWARRIAWGLPLGLFLIIATLAVIQIALGF